MAQRDVCWKEDEMGELAPTWTRSPDISVLKSLAMKYLPEGSLPVDPFFKTESEVATLAYIRQHTSIPVPRVLTYCSSSDNELRFEWILMEKIGGIPLSDMWDEMSFDTKASLTTEVCGYLRVLQDLQFTQIGSLYFSSVREQVDTRDFGDDLGAKPPNAPVNCSIGTDFVIGRVVSPWFFRDKRLFLSADRGPFPASYQFMMAKTRMQIERIKHLSALSTDDYYSETDEVLAVEQEDVLDTCYSLEKLVPYIFPPPGGQHEAKLLYHDDLSASNIMVDPVTYRVTGIVDWECVSIHLAWEVTEYPFFLRGIDVQEPPPPPASGIIEPELREIRKDWEKVCLRRLYRWTLHNDIGLSPDIMHKRKFSDCLENIEMNWTASGHWARWVLQETVSMEENPDQKDQPQNFRLSATLDS
ncbi:hypothetical protein BDV38DRAFT_282993 [Aspergillus pseudotamarii]|uniref:Aminoglycoside phosphotransferase domain-containing protein n=1 Tax=Aspergillus pseudotamarii TaxID=132259 RepID=A0A5N6SRX5_ASPPS|nr:uncharacterized protein BDV38DRAFT_282993 [Aspergillus pseudotamarii]KAE8137446.1 hypothetical protein BDV38DRAFT_282993 [Aspergillus pseudotamarii]